METKQNLLAAVLWGALTFSSARARQTSPWTWTQPEGSRSVSAVPRKPTIPSRPVSARRLWACTTSRTRADTNAAKRRMTVLIAWPP